MPKKYYILTYGCQMNIHESEKLAGILSENGYQATTCDTEADIVVLNTCCIRETAESHILGNLGDIKKLKERKPSLIVAVGGCMMQKANGAEKLLKRCPFVDIIFGTHNLEYFAEYLYSLNTYKKRVVQIWEKEKEIQEGTPTLRTSGINAWVNIMYGCNNFCSYCIVPYVRGRERSRSLADIKKEVRKLVSDGYKSITLLGQNVNSYGNDLGQNEGFAFLLKELCAIDGKFRIKFMTSHPKDLSEEVINVIAENEKLSKYIHLPVQAGSDKILQLMNRKYTSKFYLDTISSIRKRIPQIGLSSDIMVGFPSETEEDFLQTLDLIEKVKFNSLYTFVYSRRSGTPADKMEQVDEATKKSRIVKLIARQRILAQSVAEESVGKVYEMLVEEYKDGKAFGKTEYEHAVQIKTDENLIGKFVKVKVTKARVSKLIAEIY